MSALLFDIETGPGPDAADYFKPDSVRLGNLTDPEKIAAKVDEAKADFASHEACLRGMAGRVVAIGIRFAGRWDGDPGRDETCIFLDEQLGERRLIDEFWVLASQSKRIVGFNSADFDIPFLCQRSMALGVVIPEWVFDGRYQNTHRHIDLLRWWAAGSRGITGKGTLDQVSRVFGGPSKNGDGAQFHELIRGTPDERANAIRYLENDLAMTAAVHRGMCASFLSLRSNPSRSPDNTDVPM